ncbi:MAG: CheR family methyltransferase [Methylococcaceae bacterium]
MNALNDTTILSDRQFHFTDQDFQHIRKLIYDLAGINLSNAKSEMVYNRIARRLRVNGLTRVDDYLQLVLAHQSSERQPFINALTTNLTSFFREPEHFSLLAKHLLEMSKNRPIKIWCCAASTGEEPYTIAMTALEALGGNNAAVKILATDIDTQVLKTAAEGIYSLDRIEKLEPSLKKRFFLKGKGDQQDNVSVRQELKDMITFQSLNLLDNVWDIQGPFDVIFCRNVMIYFDKETQHKILKKFVPLMTTESLLIAGHTENFNHAADLFLKKGRTIYGIAR